MAKCGMCSKSEFSKLCTCHAGHQVKYPTMVTNHDCQDYEYEPSGEVVQKTLFNVPEHDYCIDCSYHFNGVCSGKQWIPYKTEPRCEFFMALDMTCKHAIPFIQYGDGIRNNKCSLRNDDRCCPYAVGGYNLECYEAGYSPAIPNVIGITKIDS